MICFIFYILEFLCKTTVEPPQGARVVNSIAFVSELLQPCALRDVLHSWGGRVMGEVVLLRTMSVLLERHNDILHKKVQGVWRANTIAMHEFVIDHCN